MCPNRDLFSTYESYNGVIVLMDNNATIVLLGSTVTGSAAVSSSSSLFDSDITELVLGHWNSVNIVSLKSKKELASVLQQSIRRKKQTGKQIKRLRTDNDMKFYEREFDEFCKNEGIVRHHTIRMTPQQNGMAERMNIILLERARCMISNAGLTKTFWADAISMAYYIVNRAPSATLNFKTPEEVEIEIGSSSPSIQQVSVDASESTDENNSEEEKYSIARDRPRRDIRPPQRYANLVAYALSVVEETDIVGEPTTYSEAVSCDDSAKWLIAMNKKIESLHRNGTWVLVKLPLDKKIVGRK
ncbi:uncharacterized protein LOC113771304 [Coffea eugenioides]|uniref:uncharacterized protein LOC113771304 n=1 Tax=Coffea eugenioides TaxID=49369 RepID=UPI000F608356|nr:uncharacterized protein LOC113771304 [Coffea eugenioides]